MHDAADPRNPAEFVTLHARAGVLVATVNVAAIDSGNADRIAAAVHAGIGREGRRLRGLVLDLAAVMFINSRGLAACIDVARAAGQAGAGAAVTMAPGAEDLRRMFEVMRVDRLLPIADDLAAATRLATSGPASPAG